MTVQAPERVRRRGVLFWLGTLLVVAGLGVLGYVGWQMYGTNVVAQHRATKIEQQTRQAWKAGEPGPAQAILHVPRFGKDYAVPIIKGFDEDTLARGIARYPKGALPGQVGNLVLAAHRVTHGEPFSKFPDLRKGDRVVVETRTGTYTYQLRNSGTSTIVPFTTSWPLYPVPEPDGATLPATKPVLTMLTCSELFHTSKRSVVVGDLVASVAR